MHAVMYKKFNDDQRRRRQAEEKKRIDAERRAAERKAGRSYTKPPPNTIEVYLSKLSDATYDRKIRENMMSVHNSGSDVYLNVFFDIEKGVEIKATLEGPFDFEEAFQHLRSSYSSFKEAQAKKDKAAKREYLETLKKQQVKRPKFSYARAESQVNMLLSFSSR